MAGVPFEWSLKGYIRNDPRTSYFLRLRTLVELKGQVVELKGQAR
jgi:hypothetical protein